MGRTKRQYPLGKYRLRLPRVPESKKAYPLDLEYTWNRQIYRKSVNILKRDIRMHQIKSEKITLIRRKLLVSDPVLNLG